MQRDVPWAISRLGVIGDEDLGKAQPPATVDDARPRPISWPSRGTGRTMLIESSVVE